MRKPTHKGSVTRHPKATLESQIQCAAPSDTHRQPEPPHLDKSRPASGRAATPHAASRAPAHSEGKPHGSVRATLQPTASGDGAEQALLEQKLLRRRQLLPANPATKRAWQPQSARAKIELRVRSVMKRAPRPVQLLVERIYPRFSPGYVMPLDEFTKGLRS